MPSSMKALSVFIGVALLAVVAVVFVADGVSIKVNKQVAEAQTTLPDGVEKFQDGEVTCYLFARYQAFATTDRVGGVSCVK